MTKYTSLKIFFTFGAFLFSHSLVQAAILSFNQRINTTSSAYPIVIGSSSANTIVQVAPGFPYINPSYKDVAVSDKITLAVDPTDLSYLPISGEINVTLQLEQWDINNNQLPKTYPQLSLDYQPFATKSAYVDKAAFIFTGAYKYKITIISITFAGNVVSILQSNLFIDADIQLERYYNFASIADLFSTTPTINPPNLLNIDGDNINDEIEISWSTCFSSVNGDICPEEYQLEWTFVNDYGISISGGYLPPGSLEYDFKNNSTRITTTNSYYRIALIFEHGYLLYRVRAIGRDINDPSKSIFGMWSGLTSTSAPDKGAVGDFVDKYYVTEAHESNKNWQYSATYAEEGKKKEVVSYFDGSLRNRQSVTKVNSSNTTIVQETIYDHQGRPAINVLPVPVPNFKKTNNSALKYYPFFNVNNASGRYNYSDFDIDLSPDDLCTTVTQGMSFSSGASNYYSPLNLNKNGIQAFVPDAEGFPFTQIEYTSDNTGRIRRQGGVGSSYQLGSGHETKYYYGQPNQVQLDRLFGSEVGDAAHYTKNLVVDGNGQISVTYLDQEGRTIATSLAGDAPKDSKNNTILEALSSETDALKKLTIDLFAKDANGKSNINTIDLNGEALVFNSQLTVANKSNYTFDYSLNVDKMNDDCLLSGVCFNCVYDLEIKITDDCGRDVSTIEGILPIKKSTGNFTSDANGSIISFNQTCADLNETNRFTVSLDIGNYTVSKILTVNTEARDFYIKTYLSTDNNSCVHNLDYFTQKAIATIDMSDCDITCVTCTAALMGAYTNISQARDAFIASGKGTELDFDYQMEECGKPCKAVTWCESTYQQLLMDVSPDGQYAQFQSTIGGQAPDLNLSVLNVGNVLPKNVAGASAHWQNPIVTINGSNYHYYLDESGTLSIIHLAPNGTNYIPEVVDPSSASVMHDNVGNFNYTYPQNLKKVADFVSNWKDSWAKSLVQYHPEYCYYEACRDYDKTKVGDTRSSDNFDSLLINTKTFQRAVEVKLIKNNGSTTTSTIADLFTPSLNPNDHPYDPFAKVGSTFLLNVAGTTFDPNLVLKDKFYNYKIFNSSFSMAQIAAITARCGKLYGTTSFSSTSPCLKFGSDVFFPINAQNKILNDNIRDWEWNYFKNFYLSEKRKVQQDRADLYAKFGCNGYNGCMGNLNYDPFSSGMIDLSNASVYSDPAHSKYFDKNQPCSADYSTYYLKKKRRFISPQEIASPSPDEMDYQLFKETGQCPMALDLQNLLSALAADNKLTTATDVSLQNYGEFTDDLYVAVSGGTMPAAYTPYSWMATSITGNSMNANILKISNSSIMCSIQLDKGSTNANWNDIKKITQLKYSGAGTTIGSSNFTALAVIYNPNPSITTFLYLPITGTIYSSIGATPLSISCNNFQAVGTGNNFAHDLNNLWSALALNNKLTAVGLDLNLNPSNYKIFITDNIKKQLGTLNNTLVWNYTGVNTFELYDVSNPNKKLIIKFTTFIPTYSVGQINLNVKSFSDIKSGGGNLFSVNCFDASRKKLVAITGTVDLLDNTVKTGVSMGTYDLPEPISCSDDEYKLRGNLENLLKDVLLKKPFEPNSIDITRSNAFTNLIKSHLSPNVQNATCKYDKFIINSNNDYKEQLNFNLHCECSIIISHKSKALQPALFSNLIDLNNLTAFGTPTADGNYCHFYVIAIYSDPASTSTLTDTIFGESCLPLKNCTIVSNPPDMEVTPLTFNYTNPCVEYQMNIAKENAENEYHQYIDKLTSDIAAKYNQHCLSAVESLTAQYEDKEYHFTLYYYDQAGNLIRTVPPEGVELVDMTLHGSQINLDRTNNQHTFFTDHRMATTYEYNSLNQLTRQSMPDHDMMDVWELTLPNGLDSRLKVTATQFVTATTGYLSGYIDLPLPLPTNGVSKRGYLYSTDDGGVTWSKMNDVVASDLKKIQMTDTDIGFAVGSHGIILKTINGGNTWDMLNTYDLSITSAFNDLYFIDNTHGVIVGDNGVSIKTKDGGNTFTKTPFSSFTGNLLSAITYDGVSFYVSIKNSAGISQLIKGEITLINTNNLNITWSNLKSIRSVDLFKIQMVTATKGFAIGNDGTLLSTVDNGTNWITIPTAISNDFKDIYFKSTSEGVAIIIDDKGKGQIWKTVNAGLEWTLMSSQGESFNSFCSYSSDKIYALGNNGILKRVVMANNYGLVNIPTSAKFDLNSASFSDADHGWIVGNNNVIYYTTNATVITPDWKQITTPSGLSFKKIYFGIIGSTTGLNTGLLLDINGNVYKLVATPAASTTNYSVTKINSATEKFVDICESPGNSGNVYAFDKTNGQLKFIVKNNISAATSLVPINISGNVTPLAVNVNSIYAENNSTVFVIGKNGDLFRANNINTINKIPSWTDNSKNISPIAINDIQAVGTNTVYAIGNDGSLLQTVNGTDWKTIPTKSSTQLNVIKFNTDNTKQTPTDYIGLIAGNDGQLFQRIISGNNSTLTKIESTISDNLYDITLNTSNKAYAIGAQGTMVSIPDISTPIVTVEHFQNLNDIKGLVFKKESNQIILVGDKSTIYVCNNSSIAKIKNVFTPQLNDVHFTNSLNGYIVGDKGTIRHTQDGGVNWSVVLPTISANKTPPLNGVYTTQPDVAFIVGNGNYVAKINNTIAEMPISPYISSGAGSANHLNDIAFDKTGKGYVVGNNAIVRIISNNGTISNSITAGVLTGFDFNALHIFNDNTFIAVGTNSKIYTYNSGLFTANNSGVINSTTTFNDVFFHDDRNGYVAGNGGQLYRCSLSKNATSTGIAWVQKSLVDIYGITSLGLSNVNITSIAFAGRYKGFLGGNIHTANNSAKVCYSRALTDESFIFSTRFWYDRLGRMVVSQNTKQYNRKNLTTQLNKQDYSYTSYDELGRIIEVGEKTDNSTGPIFSGIFGEYVGGQFNPNVINDSNLASWISADTRREVTHTFYDDIKIKGLPITQENLRNRVASITFEDVDDNNPQTFDHATHYSYDIHGNVKTLLQDTPALQAIH